MTRYLLYEADRTILVGPSRTWVITRYRALYGRDPMSVEQIKLDRPRFVAGPVPEEPDQRWIPPEFFRTIQS